MHYEYGKWVIICNQPPKQFTMKMVNGPTPNHAHYMGLL